MRSCIRAVIFLISFAAIPAQAETDSPSAPLKTFHDCKGCPEMVVVPAGSFFMGVGGVKANVSFAYTVTLTRPFAIGKTEVTQGQWRAIMGDNPSRYNRCGDQCPVESVSWDDAQDFIKKLNALTGKTYRLPTEAEWEYACKAGTQTAFCAPGNAEEVAWYSGSGGDAPHLVANKQANVWGLYDMSGNVMEWVEDSWHKSSKGASSDGSAWRGDEAHHVVRGGAFNDAARNVGSTSRNYYGTGYRGETIGFRLATSDTSAVSSDKSLPTPRAPASANQEGSANPATDGKPSATERLKELNAMHKDGLITDAEYQQKRKQILDSL